MENETWKKIPGLPAEYEVSDMGRIRRLGGYYRTTYCGNDVVRTKPPKIYGLKKKCPKGYCRINLFGRVHLVHRLVASAFLENPNGFDQVNHLNGIKEDNRLSNLEWATNYQNRRHAVENGLHHTGAKPAAWKYSEDDAKLMREMLDKGESLRSVGRHFGTCHSAVKKILSRLPSTVLASPAKAASATE